MAEQSTIMGNLRRFLDVAAGEGYVFDGIDAADLYIAFFGDGVTPPKIRELERASQPVGGELDLPGLRVAIRAFTPHMHDWISKVIDALERQPGSGEDAERMKWLAAQCENGLGLKHVGGADIVQTWFVRFPVIESGVGMTLADAIDAARASLDGRREEGK